MLVFQQIVFVYFALTVIYTLGLAIAGLIRKKNSLSPSDKLNRIAVLVPAYKEDGVITHSAASHLKADYPSDKFDVIVIADSLQKETVETMRRISVKVIEVDFEKSTKAKALNAAFEQLDENLYEIALICDADNVLEKSFLHKINAAFNEGKKAIQGRRVAKNLDSHYAILDGASEIINNHLFRKAYNNLGLSSSLIGSGMAFDYSFLKKLFLTINAVGGFDKILQLKLIEEGLKIQYLEDAVIFDEKIQSSDAFQNQRKRWLHSQFNYLSKYFIPGMKRLLKGDFDYFNLSVFYYLFPPRVLALGAMGSIALITTIINIFTPIVYIQWWFLLGAYIFSLAICLPKKFYNKKLFKALLNLPEAFLRMFLLLFKLKGANKTFIHTTHTKSEVNNTTI